MAEIEAEGKTVAEAVDAALRKAGLRREQVEVQVLQEASAGFMGFGGRPARVRIAQKHWSPEGSTPAPSPQPPSGARKPPAPGGGPARPSIPSIPSTPPAASPRSSSRSSRPVRGGRSGVWGAKKDPAPRSQDPRPPAPESIPAPARPAPAPRTPEPRRDAPGTGRRPERDPRRAEPRHESRRPAPRPPRPEPSAPLTPEQAEAAKAAATQALQELLPLMKFNDAVVRTDWDPKLERVKATIETADSSRLIGREGRTLEALQFLVTLILTRRTPNPVAVWVETAGYWERREGLVLETARRGIEQVRSTGRPFRLEPMEPAMRRLVHRSLASDPDIITASEGEGSYRKIVIRPKTGG